MHSKVKPSDWLAVTAGGLYCRPGDFYIDPPRPVARAVITHGHGDHARPGHRAVLATRETGAIMRIRFGDESGPLQPLAYGETIRLGEVAVRLVPAGHILGSAQIVLEHAGQRIVVSGDYKRRRDPTCPAFEPVPCDVFITEATFGLPVFRHPPDADEIARLLESLRVVPERAHLVGVYALGKCQRVIALLREAGYDRPIYLHGALRALTDLYAAEGQEFGALPDATAASPADLAGAVVLAPPSAIGDRWSRRLPDPLAAAASGWMRVRQRAKQRNVELPLVISDHADWDELTATIAELAPGEVWVTHGREEALVHWARANGIAARALLLAGREEEEGE
ncbi:MAG: ligase-associated DNA damage response exonuclease [Rhodospirillaceae bacterium]|nr:ligase-associated DNA damage response exonuclease [Rhodospirillaceae bacterium]